MKIFSRYVLKEMIGPTVLGFVFYTSIILMRQLFDMAGLIIKRSLSGAVVGKLLVYILPNIVVLTLPMSLLFGILIAVGRLSSDSEIVAMRALGINTRTIYVPVFLFSFLMFGLNFHLINNVMPESNRQFVALQAELTQSVAENIVKPRVFHTGYANLMIYVDDVDPATGQWKGVFVADSRNDSIDPKSATEMSANLNASQDQEDLAALSQSGAGQRIIVARSGNLALIGDDKEIWMNLTGAETHVWDPRKPDRYDLTRNEVQRIRLPSSGGSFDATTLGRSMREMDLKELIEAKRKYDRGGDSDRVARNIARVEIHKKFAIPFACIAFGILGLPLGITNRRGGKSSGFTLSIAIIVFYYVFFNQGEQLAQDGKIPAWLGMWGPNLILLFAGLLLLSRANRDFATRSEGGVFTRLFQAIGRLFKRRRSRRADAVEDDPSVLNQLDITFPNILDRYVLREFIKVLLLVLLSVAALSIIIDYTDKARDAREHGIAASTLLTYYRFYIFTVLNWTVPISVLVATLVTFALMSKNNEVTAIKSSGISLYRLGIPVLAVAAVMSLLSYLNLDFVLPYSSQRLEQVKRIIDGKPPISAAEQQKLWYLGKGRYLINFLAYDRDAKRLTQVQVFELHPTEFRMVRRVYAKSATWNGKGWSFEDGWLRSFPDNAPSTYALIKEPLLLFYPETPEDFAMDVRLPDQMTFAQLSRYVETLKESGYAADTLTVKLYEKTSWPLLSLVMALIALPFAFRMGKRGALYGIAIALILGIVYWIVFALFMKFGEVGNLPPLLAAWAANILFGLAAGYMFLNVET